jgi:4-carboxymuconolactone decarboxylase
VALSELDRRLIRLSVAIVRGDWTELRRERSAAPPGEPNRAWREAVLQSHLFAGFSRVVEAFSQLDAVGGLGELGADEIRREDGAPERGRPLFDRIYANAAPTVLALLQRQHPEYADWVIGHAYGRVLSRPGLAADRRELLACACLAAQGQDRQLGSHARGALRCGATHAELVEAVELVGPAIGPALLAAARAVVLPLASR